MTCGKVIRLDSVKGYGFITPADGGEDVFFHVNAFGKEKHLVKPGDSAEYVAERSERGLKTLSARLLWNTMEVTKKEPDEEFVDILSRKKFLSELTELLLVREPTLTGVQVRQIRECFSEIGTKYGWIVE